MSNLIQNNKNSYYSNFLQSFDFFSYSPSWSINNQNLITTNCGGFLSLIVIVLTLLTSTTSIVAFITGKNGFYEYRQIVQRKSMDVPLKKEFDLILQVDKSEVANWDTFVDNIEFRFFFNKTQDINFDSCKDEMYIDLNVDKENNALLCIYNSNNVSLNLSAKNVFESNNKLRRNRGLDDVDKEDEFEKYSEEWYKRCHKKYGTNDIKCRKT